ncbi:hypothetical protein JHW43_005885 [Diplocarpon mali]|nr:hypothetical protein JHW43_005885 [Diplocarpon mali]
MSDGVGLPSRRDLYTGARILPRVPDAQYMLFNVTFISHHAGIVRAVNIVSSGSHRERLARAQIPPHPLSRPTAARSEPARPLRRGGDRGLRAAKGSPARVTSSKQAAPAARDATQNHRGGSRRGRALGLGFLVLGLGPGELLLRRKNFPAASVAWPLTRRRGGFGLQAERRGT